MAAMLARSDHMKINVSTVSPCIFSDVTMRDLVTLEAAVECARVRRHPRSTQHGPTCGDAIGCMAPPPDRCKPAQRRNSKHMRSPGCRGAVNCRFWGCRIVRDRARPLTWDRRCLLQKRQALRMAADAPVGNARLP